MYQALYRKWRPKTFDQVVGQKHITDVLSYAVQNQNISHAYLFCGSRGTGKTTCAKILARAVNCLSPVNGSPCGKCEACRASEDGGAIDIVEMDAASNNGVNDVRDIRDSVVYAPSFLKNRVFIIDEVHMLSISAFNALLKTLEEPPANVVFILATTELQKLPATIISRCQRFDFRRIPSAEIAAHLTEIAQAESLTLDADAAMAIARLARGGMRDAISLLELNVRPDRHITLDSVREVTGMIGREELARVVRDVTSRNTEDLFSFVDELYVSSKDVSVFWQDLISYYRDMLVVKTAASPDKFLDLTGDELADLRDCASKFSYASLLWQGKVLADTGIRMSRGSDRRVEAEFALMRICDPESDTSPEALAARLTALEDRIAMGISPIPAVKRPAPADTAHALSAPTAAPRKAGDTDAEKNTAGAAVPAPTAENSWKTVGWIREVAQRFESYDPGRAAFLRDAKAYYCAANQKIRLLLPNSFAIQMLDAPETVALLRNLMQGYEKVDDLEFVTAEAQERDTSFLLIDDIINGKDN